MEAILSFYPRVASGQSVDHYTGRCSPSLLRALPRQSFRPMNAIAYRLRLSIVSELDIGTIGRRALAWESRVGLRFARTIGKAGRKDGRGKETHNDNGRGASGGRQPEFAHRGTARSNCF